MVGMFREGHNKPRPRNRPPIQFGPPRSPWRKRAPVIAITVIAILLVVGWALRANAQAPSAHSRQIAIIQNSP